MNEMIDLKSELETIRMKNGGLLTEEAILATAKAKSHPLHERFTWDDTEAARQWRLEEARMLIRSVYVTIETPEHKSISIRAYASLPTDRAGGGGYRAISDIMSNRKQREELFAAALSELDAFKRRYGNLSRLAPVFTAIDAVKTKRVFERTRKPGSRAASQQKARAARV